MIDTAPARTRTQIKICGFTRPADAVTAVELGADALGLVFYPPSSRYISIDQAVAISAAVAPFTCITALFLDADKEHVDQILDAVPVSMLQFHGNETPAYCESFKRPYMKSVSMKSTVDIHGYCKPYRNARAFLLDSNVAGAAGGSGEVFDWSLVPRDFSAPLVLAGGLDTANVETAVAQVRPDAVDVSSGVESARGIKESALMQQFIAGVRRADANLGSGL
ncbi:N-(5'-phosphoribosyl)anthranilate isomerase [Chromatiales bacterium (ex Bugula neritina AB1)]|nr:N-(5'-phosphoribosyl)anthranilate isomerase [Chromatiales bacterium (ex Bugula neritina AB1)]